MNKKKELISEIVDRLKGIEDFPYSEGAWESFKEKEGVKTKVKPLMRFSIAAAMLLLGSGLAFYVLLNKFGGQKDLAVAKEMLVHGESRIIVEEGNPLLNDTDSNSGLESFLHIKPSGFSKDAIENSLYISSRTKIDSLSLNNHFVSNETIEYPSILKAIEPTIKNTFDKEKFSQELFNHLVLANAQVSSTVLSNSNLATTLGPKNFKLADRFELGMFISPYTNSDNFRIGAGLTFAYNINDKLSVRTGASYNNYEVGILKNPFEASSIEQVDAKVVNSALYGDMAADGLVQVSKLALPNINAVTGFVQAIDIPLEVKYNVSKSFYAVAGVSYSTILNQERNLQYIQNVNFDTFNNGFPENEQEASKALEVVTQTVKSSEKNVNTNGYSGFVNFSVGKKVDVNRKFAISIEPFYKIPVGGFRKSEMNYTNAGIRLMTSF